ncbi:MAG TPA: quaternary ammonium transporter [Bacillus bacterium]|uniref:Quaternary ammonium transporter n=1 Tax=Siminovitchia fordii TaxID=254759 RepID=A0ABQ4K6C0_9BACI|nr:cadmium resistance transporter [Siminovitchia fordii]GIN20688.1 quaternary ammonium transporter [Siminovitchia fordii]HBZ08697.1 quaternary ammonium transporter [Bacillus sp. (in: firmicutes)]
MLSLIASIIIFFIATNIDDLFFLMTWFSQVKTTEQKLCIVAGQYLGFILILIFSFIGAIGAVQLSAEWIGLLGLAPIYIGIKSLRDLYQVRKDASHNLGWLFKVATITFANGADNIGVYIPFLAIHNLERIILLLVIFLVLVAVWCYLGNALVKQPFISRILELYVQKMVPFVFITLGILIMIRQGTLIYFYRVLLIT